MNKIDRFFVYSKVILESVKEKNLTEADEVCVTPANLVIVITKPYTKKIKIKLKFCGITYSKW